MIVPTEAVFGVKFNILTFEAELSPWLPLSRLSIETDCPLGSIGNTLSWPGMAAKAAVEADPQIWVANIGADAVIWTLPPT
jgi:hypothetical protein